MNDNIKVTGYKGTWYVIDSTIHDNQEIFLLEHETYGDEVACLIVNADMEVIMDNVWNGFNELESLDESDKCTNNCYYWVGGKCKYYEFSPCEEPMECTK